MAVRLFEDNRLFDALPSASITPSSESQNLPAINVQNAFRTRVWRTGNSQATETLTIDFGTPVTIDACILFYTDIDTVTGGDSNVKVMANTTNSWGAPAFTQSLTQHSITDSQSPRNYFYGFFGDTQTSPSPSPVTYRYWRISFTKAAANVTRDIGRVFLGVCYDFATEPMGNGGIQIDVVDGSNKSKGVGLNTYVEVLPQFKRITLAYTPMAQSDLNSVDTIFYRLGQNTNFYLQIDQSTPFEEIYYCKLSNIHSKKLKFVTPTTQYHDLTAVYEEQL